MNEKVIKILSVILVVLISKISYTQVDTTGHIKKGKHKVYIKLINRESRKKLKGYPIAISDSGIWVTSTLYPRTNNEGESTYKLIFIKSTEIDRIVFRRKGTIGWGIIAGSIAGVVVGVIIASSHSDGEGWGSALEEAGGGIIGLESGAIIGGIIAGQVKRRFRISGSLQKFLEAKRQMIIYLPSNPK